VIKNSKQNWTAGQTVKVGFLSLMVRAVIANRGDGMPDAYLLTNAVGDKLYRFIPHYGLDSISVDLAQQMLNVAAEQAAHIARQATARAQAAAAISNMFDLAVAS
jgi:hypothetical protein